MRIAVLGGGNGCYAAAADLAEQGHRVRLWRRDSTALDAIHQAGGIVLRDHAGARCIALDQVGGDLAGAVRGAEVLLIPLPAFAQRDLALQLAPQVEDGQIIFLPPGTFGSVFMAQELRRAGCRAQLSFAESGTLPYLARKRGAAEIAITIRAKRLPTGVFPAREAEATINRLRAAYPAVEGCGDALSCALVNAGPIIHPPLILMNAAPLEHFERWDIHNEGTQPAVRRVTDLLDSERIALREALGYGAPHFPLRDHYTSDRWMYGDANDRLVDSGDWREHISLTQHRYMTEDVALGLYLLTSAARWAGVATPIADGLFALGGAVCGRDFRGGERSFAALGLAGFSRAQLGDYLHHGLD